MAPEETSRPWRSATYAASIGLAAASASMAQTSSATTYSGQAYVVLDRTRIPVHIPGIADGAEVQVMIKKGPETDSIRVWPHE